MTREVWSLVRLGLSRIPWGMVMLGLLLIGLYDLFVWSVTYK